MLFADQFNGPVVQPPRKCAQVELNPFPELYEHLTELVRTVTDAVGKSVQHFQGDEAWTIGTMPGCGPLADMLENRCQAALASSNLTGAQIDDVAGLMKSASDLRVAARAAQQVAQIAWLLRHESGEEMFTLVRTVGEATLSVSLQTTSALQRQDARTARHAALLFRSVDGSRYAAERELESQTARSAASPVIWRLTRSAIWFMAVAGEGMARVAARAATGLENRT